MILASLVTLALSLPPAWPAPAPTVSVRRTAAARERAGVGPREQKNAPAAPFTLGVLRRDGHVIPFAAFDGKAWSAPWPAARELVEPIGMRRGIQVVPFVDVPISLGAVPDKWWGKAGRPAEMTIWAGGVNRGHLQLERPAMRPTTCSTRLALRTNYRSDDAVPASPFEQPHPKDGLAVSGTQPIEPIESVPRASQEWIDMVFRLLEPVDTAEQQAINVIPSWKHPLERIARRKVPVEIEALYHGPVDAKGWTAYYVEAVKNYRPGPDDGDCGLVTFASGWVMMGPAGERSFRLTARITYCDRRGVSYLLPLGFVRVAGQTFWVYQVSGYDEEHYVVTRQEARRIEHVVVYAAGVCAQR